MQHFTPGMVEVKNIKLPLMNPDKPLQELLAKSAMKIHSAYQLKGPGSESEPTCFFCGEPTESGASIIRAGVLLEFSACRRCTESTFKGAKF